MCDYLNVSDEELIGRLRTGQLQIQDYLLEKYKPLVKSKCRVMYLAGADKEDLIQEGMIGLFKAIRDFDPGKKVPFASFAKMCVERQIYTAVEAAGRLKHAPLNSYISLSEEEDDLMDSGVEELVIERENFQQEYQRLQKLLSPLERQVLELHLEGKKYTEIAEILKKPAKSIDNALQRIKSKYRKFRVTENKLTE
ncbi:MAG: sigma-70 family RNA polymerase sigma factor [Lachnospiraceae bacterium]